MDKNLFLGVFMQERRGKSKIQETAQNHKGEPKQQGVSDVQGNLGNKRCFVRTVCTDVGR